MTTAFSERLYGAIIAGRDTPDGADSRATNLDRDHDQPLVHRVRAGDTDAFAILVKYYIERVTRFAMHLGVTRDVAEDLVQNVFVSIWEQRALLDPNRSFRGYLFRAVRNRAIDERSAQGVRYRYAAEIRAQNATHAEPALSEGETLAETDLEPFIRRLPHRRQMAIRLRYDGGLSHAEIGEVMGISPMAATQLVLRGLEELKKLLGV